MNNLVGYCVVISAFLLSVTEQAEKRQEGLSSQGTDCTQIKALSPQATSGVYVVQPPGETKPFKVYCEMRKDGGWTVFQRRSGGQVSFSKKWAGYKHGFGDLTGDHWLGLQKVYCLSKNKTQKWTMRVDLWDHVDATAYAEYKNFRLSNIKHGFKLHVGKYKGDAGDAIRGVHPGNDQNGFGFSTIDRDNDGCNPCLFGDIAQLDCASSEGGGWWYSRCGSASLNGDWHPAGEHIGWASGIHWETWKTGAPYSLKATRMMIKSV